MEDLGRDAALERVIAGEDVTYWTGAGDRSQGDEMGDWWTGEGRGL